MGSRMPLLRTVFVEHPASVGETYLGHLLTASRFGATMIIAGAACVIHGIVPVLFTTRGSDAIRALHQRMIVNRR